MILSDLPLHVARFGYNAREAGLRWTGQVEKQECLYQLKVVLLWPTCRTCEAPWPSPPVLWSGWGRSAARWCSRWPVPLGHSLLAQIAPCRSPERCGWQKSRADDPTPHHLSAADTDSTWGWAKKNEWMDWEMHSFEENWSKSFWTSHKDSRNVCSSHLVMSSVSWAGSGG